MSHLTTDLFNSLYRKHYEQLFYYAYGFTDDAEVVVTSSQMYLRVYGPIEKKSLKKRLTVTSTNASEINVLIM